MATAPQPHEGTSRNPWGARGDPKAEYEQALPSLGYVWGTVQQSDPETGQPVMGWGRNVSDGEGGQIFRATKMLQSDDEDPAAQVLRNTAFFMKDGKEYARMGIAGTDPAFLGGAYAQYRNQMIYDEQGGYGLPVDTVRRVAESHNAPSMSPFLPALIVVGGMALAGAGAGGAGSELAAGSSFPAGSAAGEGAVSGSLAGSGSAVTDIGVGGGGELPEGYTGSVEAGGGGTNTGLNANFDPSLGGQAGNFPASSEAVAAANEAAAAPAAQNLLDQLPNLPPAPPGSPSGNSPTTPTTPGSPSPTPTSSPNTSISNLLQSMGINPSIAGSIVSALVSSGLAGGGGAAAGTGTGTSAADTAAQIAREQWEYYKTNYQPLEQSLIAQAKNAGSPEEFQRAAGQANADVTGAFNQAGKQSESRLQSYGINPAAPAYQNAMQSADLAQGATMAGALTTAGNRVRDLAYSKGLDVVGLGRNIPAQSAASSAAASNAATSASRNAFLQNQSNMAARGQLVAPIANAVGSAARDWFGANSFTPSGVGYGSSTTGGSGGAFDYTNSSGNVMPEFARGGIVGEERQPTNENQRMQLKMLLMKRGMSDIEADRQSRMAMTRRFSRGGLVKKAITPHMRGFKPPSMYADGGGVGRQGMTTPDASNMGELQGPGTGTSDSIPATIDGQQPAALSTGEVVVNADAVGLSGKEILDAINQAGMKRRQQNGIEPQDSNDISINAGSMAYARGGRVSRVGIGV